jgi:hypothetical protein
MGNSTWSNSDWNSYSTSHIQGKTQAQVFTKSAIDTSLSAASFTDGVRESVDSDANPASTPVCIFADVTGSMGMTAEAVMRRLDVVCEELYDRKPITDPHILTGAIGDAYTDSSPFQATQFEADIKIAEQTQKLFLEGRGGGNGGESYALAWLFAALQTRTDSWDKRNKKGYIFTIGDEPIHMAGVTKSQAKRFLALDIERDYTAQECLEMAQRKWNVFHVVIETHTHYRAGIEKSFGSIMPDNLLWLEDVKILPELIVSTIQVTEGADKATVSASWSGDTSLVVANALKGITTQNGNQAIVRL